MIHQIIAGITRDLIATGTSVHRAIDLPMAAGEWQVLARFAGRKLGTVVTTTATSSAVAARVPDLPESSREDDRGADRSLSDPRNVQEGDRLVVVSAREDLIVGEIKRTGTRLHIGDFTVRDSRSGPNLLARVIARESPAPTASTRQTLRDLASRVLSA